MNKSILVFRNEFEQFNREKGMMFFYCLTILIVGIIVPIFIKNLESALIMSTLLTAKFLNPILSDSLAGEREHQTLETLLSTPISGRQLVLGKFLFSILFSICFFGLSTIFAVLTHRFVGYEITIVLWQWIGIIVLAVLNFITISITGVYVSATSGDLQVANNRVSRIVYPLGLLFVTYITILVSIDFFSILIISFVLILIYFIIISIYTVKIIMMKQFNYFENIKSKKTIRAYKNNISNVTPKSQFFTVLGFEFKYLMTLKTLLLNFGAMCIAPTLIMCILCHYTGKLDINYSVLMITLLIPRVPTNLIAFSIGGEKVYKTGESLLSTPLHIRTIFLAKCMIPIIISTVMLIISSLLTLLGEKIVNIVPNIETIQGYTLEQLVLLFPVSIMSTIAMMFIAAILTVIMKTPRQGLYVNSVISFFFIIPVLGIVYLTNNVLIWSVIYFITLTIFNVICVINVSDKIFRPKIMSML